MIAMLELLTHSQSEAVIVFVCTVISFVFLHIENKVPKVDTHASNIKAEKY